MNSSTQENWNSYWGNKKTNYNHQKPPILLVVILLICIISAGYYYKNNGGFEENKTTKNDLTKQTNKFRQSNKDGVEMKESIDTLRKILERLETYTSLNDDEKQALIDEIYDLNLSIEYNSLKENMVKKIEYYQICLNEPTIENYAKYNTIDYIDFLEKCFKKVGIKYTIKPDDSIEFIYHEY